MTKDGKKNHSGRKALLSKGEKRRLRQLVICLALFAAVFVGRGMNVGPLSHLSDLVENVVGQNTDFQAVFSQMGESFSRGEPAIETFRSLWSGTFSQEEQEGQREHEAVEEGGEDSEETDR